MMKKRLRLEVYKPKRKIKISREEAVPFLLRVGAFFLTLGGVISFIFSGVIFGIKSFFVAKEKIYNRKIHYRKYSLRVKRGENGK